MRAWELSEVQILSKIHKKGRNLSNLPKYGRPIPPGLEQEYLGKQVARMPGGYQVWRYREGTNSSYSLYDPNTRRSTLSVSGSRYPNNPNSFIVFGVYAAPGNPVRASEFYKFLITELGLTLVSDRFQSEGGYKVWQELERRYPKTVTVYAFNTKTNDLINAGTNDTEFTHVTSQDLDRAPEGMRNELKNVANNMRLVATAKK